MSPEPKNAHRVTNVPRAMWYLLLVIYVSMFAFTVVSLLYTDHVATQNEQKWCHLLSTLDTAYSQTPPKTESGVRVAADVHKLLEQLNCGKDDR